ncbi:MAG: efflux RND transporter periplasmic adaptor subunit [Paludibacteraceae bacterium]|nr:efflux RND transporter periplasmic adaptor subunit [Paludibacteraceae bacterium]MBO7315629.1 efflux RND transporter periplasmic adaptor subunit [Paludibacteraceae bacterium]
MIKICKEMVAISLLATLLVACGDNKNVQTSEENERVEQVRVQKIEATQFDRKINLSTTLQGYETQNVAPSVTGKIEKIFVEEGSRVAKGDDLVRMDQLQYKTTKLAYANLGVELARVEALLKTGSATQQTYDQLKLSYDQTKENLDFMEQNTYVKAPFSGVISAKNYEDGELYSGQPILILTQINLLKAEIAVPEQHFPNVKRGMEIELRSEIYPDQTFMAVIETVFPTIDPATHTFQVKVRIPNAKELLRPGMYVNATLPLGTTQAIVVPYQAVLKMQGSNERFVFVNENGYAKRIRVTLGQRFDDKTEIVSNEINVGDDLVVVGQARLIDGIKLNVNE